MITVNILEEEITITINTDVLQTLLETTANDLLEVFKDSQLFPGQPDDKVRGDILRVLNYDIKKALMDSQQQSQSLENESMSEVQRNEPGPSTSSPNLNSAGVVIELHAAVDSEQEDSESVICEQSPKMGRKRSHEESHLSSPPTKRVCSSTPMRNSTCFNTTVSNSSANSQNEGGAASESILSLNSITPSGNMCADVTCRNFQASQNELIPSTSSPSGKSSFSGGSSVTFKRSCYNPGSNKSQHKSNQEPANILNKRSTTECVQQAKTVNSKSDESSNDSQPTGNTTNSEKSTAGPSHKTGIILLSEKASTSEASTKQNNIIDSQGSATSTRTKKIYKQSHLVMHDRKQSQASTSHGLSLLVSPIKEKVPGGNGSSKSTKQPRKKESHLASQVSSSADRKRGSRCPKSKRYLCPICSKPDCGKCKNCL